MMEETAPLQSNTQQSPTATYSKSSGTILEGAFIDSAYTQTGDEANVANNRYEVVSKGTGSTEDDLAYPEVPKIKARRRVITETEVVTTGRCGGLFKCCTTEEAVVNTHTETMPVDEEEKERLKKEYLTKRADVKKKRRERKLERAEEQKYSSVPDGVLVYRLDTAQNSITLISAPNGNTDMTSLMTEMNIIDAMPSESSSRRGILLIGDDGAECEIVACEQRTATSWMEALNMMLGKDRSGKKKVSYIMFESITI